MWAVRDTNRFWRHSAAALLFLGLILLMSGCGPGLPKDLKKKVKAVPDIIETYGSRVDKNRDRYKELAGSPQFKAFEIYASQEDWPGHFTQAEAALARAKDLFDRELAPLVKQNRPEDATRVEQQMERIQEILTDAQKQSAFPVQRFSLLKQSMENAQTLAQQATADAKAVNRIKDRLQTDTLAKTLADFPNLAPEINARFAPVAALAQQSGEHLNTAAKEYERHTAGSGADYAAFADSVAALAANHDKAGILEAKFKKETEELYISYTKILKDMKATYFVTVKRESWNENSNYYDPRHAVFERRVSPETYDMLTAENLDTIAAITPGFTGSRLSTSISDSIWKELAINPTAQWPGRGHNAASFWVEDADERYFHKYILETNGEIKETDWEQVDENVYFANLEFLGMAILSKPYGVFENDRITQASPPGMAYVGNSRYGKWQEDNSGNRFWSWYGKYAFFSSLFFFPPSYYSYNSWHGWNNNYRNRQPYFGKTSNGFQKYGTSGTFVKKSPTFQNTNFAKSGGFKSQAASVRGAGSGLRGGGPKSKGK